MTETNSELKYSNEEVIEALIFILEYLTPFAFDSVEDMEVRMILQNRWERSTAIRQWYQEWNAKETLKREVSHE